MKGSLSFWKDYICGKYPSIKISDIFHIYISASPMWSKYSIDCDRLIQNILENGDKIDHLVFDKSDNGFYIFYPDGRYIKIPIRKSLTFFLEDIICFDKDGKRVYSWYGYRPSRIMMLLFLYAFRNYFIIRHGKLNCIDPESKMKLENFFSFEEQDNG